MATNLLSDGTSASTSLDFTLASSETASLVVRNPAGLITTLFVDQKDEAGEYHQIGVLQSGSQILTGPGTFRVRRDAGGKSCGVFRG